jgi:hypothetical protein
MVRPSGRLYDLTLAHGSRDAAKFSLLCPTDIVGLPKFDDWFSGRVGTVSPKVKEYLSPKKPTLLYLPTHSDLCSIEYVTPVFAELATKYTIIAKIHYATARVEDFRRKLLEEAPCLVVDDREDILPLFACSDVILSDNSSAIFEAMLADVPVVVTDFWTPEYLTGPHQRQRRQSGGAQSALSYPGSLEQVIKRDGSVVTCTEVSQLVGAVDEACADTKERKEKRREISDLFTFRDGTCGERAASAIETLLTSTVERERPILYYALSDLKEGVGGSSGVGVHEPPLSHIETSVVLLHIDEISLPLEQRQKSLLSVLAQQTQNTVKVTVAVYSTDIEHVSLWVREWSQKAAALIQPNIIDGKHSALADVIQQVFRGGAIFSGLTHSSHCYAGDWVERVVQVGNCFPRVGAVSVGGQTSCITSYSGFHDVPYGILYRTVFRTKCMLGMTVPSFNAIAFEAGIKRNLFAQAEWVAISGLVNVSEKNNIDWYAVGRSESLVGVSIVSGLWARVRSKEGGWREYFAYVWGYYRR